MQTVKLATTPISRRPNFNKPILTINRGATERTAEVVLVVEGTNDTAFLRRISGILHRDDPSLPDLADWESTGRAIFLPFGGGNVQAWTHRLAPLACAEFFLFDHELPPETETRLETAAIINRRHNCRAVVSQKRSLENYLHASAIAAASGLEFEFGDFDPLGEITAKHLYQLGISDTPWELLTRRARSRMTQRAKRWLNTQVAERMTTTWIDERDSHGEIRHWLQTIADLAERR